jgi:hypothetical protein
MAKKNKGTCLSCNEAFTADVRNRGRQKYSSKPQCRQAAKAGRQARWRQKPQNRDYFCGPEHVQRVRAPVTVARCGSVYLTAPRRCTGVSCRNRSSGLADTAMVLRRRSQVDGG